MRQNYPHGIDCVWLATDAEGRLAAMITGGCGPIPPEALSGEMEIFDVEAELLGLPINGEAILRRAVPDPSSFRALGSRGLYVYDWTDLHRTTVEATGRYELVTEPLMPARRDQLPDEIACAAVALADTTIGSERLKV